MRALPINAETTMFTSVVPIPTVGNLPVNSFLIRGEEPTLVDTGITPEVRSSTSRCAISSTRTRSGGSS